MLSNLLLEDLQKGYDLSCKELQDLILYRLNTQAEEIFDALFETSRSLVDNYCLTNSIDLAQVLMKGDSQTKKTIALDIIEAQILESIKTKAQKDPEIKELGLKPYVISNQIENAPWLILFNSPLSLQWWTKNTDYVLNKCPEELKEHLGYKKLVRVVNAIRDNWIRSQEVLPDIEAYNELMSFKVPPEVQDLMSKFSGQ